jgi:hypothetical protein
VSGGRCGTRFSGNRSRFPDRERRSSWAISLGDCDDDAEAR